MKSTTCLLASVVAMASLECQAFHQQVPISARPMARPTFVGYREAATGRVFQQEKPNHFLLNEFATYAGEVVNPYTILKVSQEADRTTIRRAYVDLSKRYHPDGVRQRDVLPGNCNNLEDVREEWERIKLSYEILSDKRTRRRYDRHAMVADPGPAIAKAALGVVGKGISGLGKGIFDIGLFAAQRMVHRGE